MQTVLDALVGVPALVRSSTLDLFATNSLARALYSDLYADTRTAPNVARFTFLDPRARQYGFGTRSSARSRSSTTTSS